MGWTGTTLERGQSVNEFFDKEFSGQSEEKRWSVVVAGTKNFVHYAVIRVDFLKEGRAHFFASITKFQRKGSEIMYKDMSESVGPYYFDVPDRVWRAILTLIPEPPNDWAREWRKKVAALKSVKKPEPGMTLKLAVPLKFTDGQTRDTFQVYKAKRGVGFRCVNTGVTVKISNLKEREYELS